MSFNLAFFNGDVRRDRKQEAMLKSMNERDNFLIRLQEMERKREIDETQEKASRKIQKSWKSYRTRKTTRHVFREHFDRLVEQNRERNLLEVDELSKLVANFYECHKDDDRLVMTLVELVKARTANKEFEKQIPNARRLLLGRCCVKFLMKATENTIFFHVFRFLEDYVISDCLLFESVSEMGLFDAEFHLFEALLGKRDETIQKAALSPRHLQLLSRIFDVFVFFFATVLYRTVRFRTVLFRSKFNIATVLFRASFIPSTLDDAFLEGLKSCDIHKWNVPPELLPVASSRIRAIFLSQIEHIDRTQETSLRNFFDSLATFLDTNTLRNTSIKDDFSRVGRIRSAALSFLDEHCQNMLNSDAFRRAACTYSFLSPINVHTVIALREHFLQLLDTLSASNFFVEALYNFITSNSVRGEFEVSNGDSPVASALILFSHCLKKRISSVADSDFVPADVFVDFDRAVVFLRDVSIKLVNLMFPNLRGNIYPVGNQRQAAIQTEIEWREVAESVFSILAVVYQKDIRIKYFPEGFWTDHGREVLSGLGDQRKMPRRRFNNGRMQMERTVDSEFVERLAAIYESDDSGSEDDDRDQDRDLPVSLRRAICVMKQIPFIVPFMDRVQLFNRLLRRERDKHYEYHPMGVMDRSQLTVRREHVYVDAFDQFSPRHQGDRVNELKAPVRVRMVNWTGMTESGVDGGGIFREFLSELLKTAFDVDKGFFTSTESRLLYPNPMARHLLGAEDLQHFQFIGRMLGKLIYERQLQEVRFAEFFIAQIFESDKNKDVDLQHMKSFDPLIFKNLKNLLKLEENELEDLQLDFSVVTDDMGLVRTVNLKPNGSKYRVNVDNVHEYVRLYVNHHLRLRIAKMVEAIRRGISEVISIEWMRMFAPHELQILIAGNENVFTAREMRKYCEMRFSQGAPDHDFMEIFWDVVDKLSPTDKRALLRFVTGCSRPPIDGFKSIYPALGIVVSMSSDDTLPTSATCMNMLTIPRYSTRAKLEEKLRYAINSGAGFELT
uniref:HECT-type E3 ubiquitin transferase n=1 Tax=Caenorhabditis japonica TaxID=281687 RepID=A0A8R1I1T2_CAEJA